MTLMMRSIAVLGGKGDGFRGEADCIDFVETDGIRIPVAIVRTPPPVFSRTDPEFANKVLVRKRAFSLNFRERRGILLAAARGRDTGYYPVGTDFVADVLETGFAVESLRPGDRVIGDNSYPGSRAHGLPQGLATIHASREYEVLHAKKVLRIPEQMPDDVAGGFSVGAQTAYAILRALQVTDGSRVLVTAARSNTSLFAINALRKYRAEIHAIARTSRFEDRLRNLGVCELAVVEPEVTSLRVNEHLADVANLHGGFSHVIDPFCDLYCRAALDVMACGGKYVTCGFFNQYVDVAPAAVAPKPLDVEAMSRIITGKLHIIGNCLGSREDLQSAVRDFAAGCFPVVIDSVFDGAPGPFLRRSLNDPDRFGRVVYRYL